MRIYLSPDVGPDERQLLLDAFDSNWIAPLGPHVDAFEREFAEAVGVPLRGRAVERHGRAAPRADRRSASGAGDEVLDLDADVRRDGQRRSPTSAPSRSSSTCRADTWTIDPELLERGARPARAAHGRLPAAVITVDLYGQCADYDAHRRGLRPSTACRSSRTPPRRSARPTATRRPARSASARAFSFNGNKIITTSGGGMLVSHRRDVDRRARATSRRRRASRRRTTSTARSATTTASATCSRRSAAASCACCRASVAAPARDQRRSTARRSAMCPASTFMPEAPYGTAQLLADLRHHRPGRVRRDPRGHPAGARGATTSRRGRCGSRCTCSRCSATSPMRGGAVGEGPVRARACACRAARHSAAMSSSASSSVVRSACGVAADGTRRRVPMRDKRQPRHGASSSASGAH